MPCSVSVVLPIFNVENYLAQALGSLERQTLTDIEVLCVDDGSTDDSLAIAQGFAERDERFVALRQDNKGAAEARNLGLEHARGEYVIFLDSDDYFEASLLEKLHARIAAENADICMCGAYDFYCATDEEIPSRSVLRKSQLPHAEVFSRRDCLENLFGVTSPAPWSKLYRKQFLLDKKLRFQNLTNSNDVLFYVSTFASAQSITYVTDLLVHYRRGRPGSLQNADRVGEPTNFARALFASYEYLAEYGYLEELSRAFGNFAASMIVYNLNSAKCFEAYKGAYSAAVEFMGSYYDVCSRKHLDVGDRYNELYARMNNVPFDAYLFRAWQEDRAKADDLSIKLKQLKSMKIIKVFLAIKRRLAKVLGHSD